MNSDTEKDRLKQNSHRRPRVYQFRALRRRDRWISPAYVSLDARGIIQQILQSAPQGVEVENVNGFALPGFHNAHSHAFQFAMAGMAEKHDPNAVDDFWSWREAMYACALTIDPGQMIAIAAMLYAEMLKRGYTHVAEFQYLHHDRNGKPYDNLAEMSVCLLAAASIAGIRITLVPVFYQKGGFGREADPSQRRFCFNDIGQYFRLLDDCGSVVRNLSTARLGFGVHSLRAAEPSDIREIAANGPAGLPFHIHAAEQLKEVNDSMAHLKQRPVEWLLNNLDVNEKYHLIHCTHLSDDEVTKLGRSRASVVLCPGTEANLGDGIFRLTDFAQHSNRWSIGTDSHISLNPLEDLRWLDYTQRLASHKRNTFADGAALLLSNAFFSGKGAMGLTATDFFETGQPFDAVVYDSDSPLLSVAGAEHLLPTLMYTADSSAVMGTIVDGEWITKRNAHKKQDEILADFRKAVKDLQAG